MRPSGKLVSFKRSSPLLRVVRSGKKIVRFVRGAARRARKLDGEAPRRSQRSAGRNVFCLMRLSGRVGMRLQSRTQFTIYWPRDAFGVREFHCEDQRFVVESLRSAAAVLHLHHEVILI
jgi:hypothetical protein